MHSIIDGLQNLVANLGTSRDKAASSEYTFSVTPASKLEAMYNSSAIAEKIVDLPAEDAVREWREWQAGADEITAIEAEETRLGLTKKLLAAAKEARLFGGSAIYIGTGEFNTELPLQPERLAKGGIEYLTVISRDMLTAQEADMDPRSPFYGQPSFYTVRLRDGGEMNIHPSRLVVLSGKEALGRTGIDATGGWGLSSLESCIETIRNMDATMANIASLVFESKVDVIEVPGLTDGIRDGGAEYENTMIKRFSLAQTGKGINGTLIIDADEKYTQKSANFSGLPNIVDRFMLMTSAAASIPMTLLFGMSPAGLNSSGDSETRGYYDRVKVMQALKYQPAMAILDECLIRSALGSRPDEIFYNWRPLWQPTAKEKAETGKVIAETFKVVLEMSVLPEEAIAKAMVNGLTESGLAPGLEGDVEEFGGVNEDDDDRGALEPVLRAVDEEKV